MSGVLHSESVGEGTAMVLQSVIHVVFGIYQSMHSMGLFVFGP